MCKAARWIDDESQAGRSVRTAVEMGAKAAESEKLVGEHEGGSPDSGSPRQKMQERSDAQDAKANLRQSKMQPKRLRKVVVRCVKRISISPLYIFKRARDCYVSSLGGCANNFGSYQPGFGGGGGMSSQGSFAPSPANYRARHMESQRFDENCLSPAFKKAFNDAVYSRSASYVGYETAKRPFRNSFEDYENPTMRRAYSEATAFSRFPRGSGIAYRGPSPGWTPNRIGAGIMFPIQETPEYIRPSLRKVSDNILDEDDFAFSKKSDGTPEVQKVKDDFEAGKDRSHDQKDEPAAMLDHVKEDVIELQSQGEVFQKMARLPTPPLAPSISM